MPHRVRILTAGAGPPLAAFEAEEASTPGLLSLVSDLASSTAASLLGRAAAYVPRPGRSLLGGLRRGGSAAAAGSTGSMASASASASSSAADLASLGQAGGAGHAGGRRRGDKIPGEPASLAAAVWDEKRCVTQMALSPWCAAAGARRARNATWRAAAPAAGGLGLPACSCSVPAPAPAPVTPALRSGRLAACCDTLGRVLLVEPCSTLVSGAHKLWSQEGAGRRLLEPVSACMRPTARGHAPCPGLAVSCPRQAPRAACQPGLPGLPSDAAARRPRAPASLRVAPRLPTHPQIVRMLKGYRDAQVAWLVCGPPSGGGGTAAGAAAAAVTGGGGWAAHFGSTSSLGSLDRSAPVSLQGSAADLAALAQDRSPGTGGHATPASASSPEQRAAGGGTSSPAPGVAPAAAAAADEQAEQRRHHRGTLLVTHAPRRGLVELWEPHSLTRLGSLHCGSQPALLLQQPARRAGGGAGGRSGDRSGGSASGGPTPNRVLLLDAASLQLTDLTAALNQLAAM